MWLKERAAMKVLVVLKTDIGSSQSFAFNFSAFFKFIGRVYTAEEFFSFQASPIKCLISSNQFASIMIQWTGSHCRRSMGQESRRLELWWSSTIGCGRHEASEHGLYRRSMNPPGRNPGWQNAMNKFQIHLAQITGLSSYFPLEIWPLEFKSR